MAYKNYKGGYKSFIVAFPLLLSLILPCIHLYSIRANPTFQVPVIDSMEYVKTAGKMVKGSLFETGTDHLSPLYTWLVALVFSVFGVGKLLPVKLFQILLNLGSALLLYKIVLAVFSKREAVISLYIWAFYGPIIFFTCEIISVPLILFVYNLSVYMLLVARREKNALCWGVTGLAFGVSVLARPDILIFLFILTGILLFSLQSEGKGVSGKRAIFSCFVSGALIPLIFASFISYSASGDFRFLPADSGLNFYMGNNPDYAKTIGARPGLFWDSLTELPEKEGLTEAGMDRNRVYYKMVWRHMLNDFPDFIKNITYKKLTLFNGYELPSTLDIYTFAKYSPLLSVLTWTVGWFSFPFTILLPVACCGIWVERGKKECLWLLLIFFSFFISLVGFWNSGRYRMVLIPFLIIFASRALVYIYGLYSEKESEKHVAAFAVVVVFAALFNISYQHFSKNYNFEAEMYAFTGIHLAKRENQYEEALRRLKKSLDLQKQSDSGCSGHSFFLQSLSNCGEILSSYQSSLKGHTYLAIAGIYLATTRYEKSFDYYKLAIETGAVSFLAYNNLGTLMVKQKKFEKGLNYFKKSIEFRPDYPVSHTGMGIALLRSGRPAEALKQFAEVIRLGADDSDAFYNLAVALVEAEFGRDAVVSLLKSLNIRQERAIRVFVYMKRFKDGASSGKNHLD